jgi:lysyl-tRNA synthetase class 2
MMDFVEQMIKRIVSRVADSLQITYGDYQLNFEKPFDRLNLVQALEKYSEVTARDVQADTIDATLKRYDVVPANKKASVGEKQFALFEELVESKLIQPTFIIDMPIEVSPLAKRKEDDPTLAARYELFIAGMEIANSFNELNDPFDQAGRFKAQVEARESGDQEAHHYDEDYITALEYALPPTAGAGVGIDRLVMLLTNTQSIKDVILFPTLKRK